MNEVICHGIPDSRPLEDGDIVSMSGEEREKKWEGKEEYKKWGYVRNEAEESRKREERRMRKDQ